MFLRLEKRQPIKIGRFPETYFEPGYYVYVGRTRRGLKARIQRHLKKNKKTFRHIDYLTRKAQVTEILTKPGLLTSAR